MGWGKSTYDTLGHFVGALSNNDGSGAATDAPRGGSAGDTDKQQQGEFDPSKTKDFFAERYKRTNGEDKTKEALKSGRKSGMANIHAELKSATNLEQGLGRLSSVKRVILHNDKTGISIPAAGAALGALPLASNKDLSAENEAPPTDGGMSDLPSVMDALGPIVLGYDDKLYKDTQARPKFIFDLRRIYNPGAALSDEKLAEVVDAQQGRSMSREGLPPSIFQYFVDNPDVLNAFLEGFANPSWLDNKPRYVNEKQTYKLQHELRDKPHLVPKVRDELYAEGRLRREKLDSFLLSEILLLTHTEVAKATNQSSTALKQKVAKMVLALSDYIRDGFPPISNESSTPPMTQNEINIRTSPAQEIENGQKIKDVEEILGALVGPSYRTMEEAKQALDEGREWLWQVRNVYSKVDLRALKTAPKISILSPLLGEDGAPRRFTFSRPENPQEPGMMDGLLDSIRSKYGGSWGADGQNQLELYKYLRGMGPIMEIVDSEGAEHLVRIEDAFNVFFDRWDDNRRLHGDFDLLPKTEMSSASLYERRAEELQQAIEDGLQHLQEGDPKRRPLP